MSQYPSITSAAEPANIPAKLPWLALLALAMTGFICILTETIPAGLLPLIGEKGIHAAVIALIVVAAYRMAKSAIFDKATAATALVVLVVLLFTGINPLYGRIGR